MEVEQYSVSTLVPALLPLRIMYSRIIPVVACVRISILLGFFSILDMISIFLNLLRRVLCHNIWSILENVPCLLEKNVYSAAFGWNVLYKSFKLI